MSTLQPIQLDEHTVIYIEANGTAETAAPAMQTVPAEQGRTAKGILGNGNGNGTAPGRIAQVGAQNLENTVRYYTMYMLQAFKRVAISEVKKVNLEFGVNMSGMTGIPYIAAGTAGCNVKVTVECVFEADNQGSGK
jgi:hypothetical protein